MRGIRENVPPTQHYYASRKMNNAVLGLDVLKGMLLNSIEQLFIADIRN